MTWENSYRQHALWENLRDALAELSQVDDDRDEVSRLRALLADTEGYKDSPHPALTDGRLNNANEVVTTIRQSIPDGIDAIFQKPRNGSNQQSPMLKFAQEVRNWPASGTVKLNGLHQQVSHLENRFDSLKNRIESEVSQLEETTSNNRASADTALEDHKAAADDQLNTLREQIQQEVSGLQTELTRIQETASDAEATTEQQKSRLDKAITDQQESFSAQQRSHEDNWSAWLADRAKEADAHQETMDNHLEQSEKVLSAVGVNSTATDYGAYATEQGKLADRWRNWASLAFSVAALFFLTTAGASFLGFGADLSWWQVVVQRVGAPLGVAAVATFLALESRQHRKQERDARRVQLTLTALEPFIARLTADQQQQIRLDTARSIFAYNQPSAKQTTASDSAPGNDADGA